MTFTLRFHFCTPRRGNLHLSGCKPPREAGVWGGAGRVTWAAGGGFFLGVSVTAGCMDISRCRRLGLSSLSVSCRSALGRKAVFSTLSILVALLIAGQAVTIYFVYQQSGQISKLTKTSQTLQLEALQRRLPASQ